jgi:hypothetical protein
MQRFDHWFVFFVTATVAVSAGQLAGKYLATQAKLPGLAKFFRS